MFAQELDWKHLGSKTIKQLH